MAVLETLETHASPTQAEPLSFGTKLLYGLGYVPDVIMNNVVVAFAMMIYNVELGVPATWISIACSLPRLWEAFTDPYIGNLSDNAQTRWGRRRPFIVVGAILAGILCAALWMPPRAGHLGLVSYFLIVSILYFTAYAIFSVPYLAMGLEMATTESDRTSLMGFRAAAVPFAFIAVMPWAPVLVTNGMCGKTPVESVRVVGMLLGALIILMGCGAALACREPKSRAVEAHGADGAPKISLLQGFEECLSNRAFLMVTGIVALTIVAFCVATQLVYYMNLAIVFPGGTLEAKYAATKLAGLCTTLSNILGIVFCLAINPLAKWIGRKNLLLLGLAGLLTAFAASPLLFSRQYPYLQLIFQTLVTLSVSCVWVLTLPMLGDVCDQDKARHGVSRQGMFTAMFNWGTKAAISFYMLMSGLIIDFSHFMPTAAFQSPRTIAVITLGCALFPVPFMLLAMLLTWHFPYGKSPENTTHG